MTSWTPYAEMPETGGTTGRDEANMLQNVPITFCSAVFVQQPDYFQQTLPLSWQMPHYSPIIAKEGTTSLFLFLTRLYQYYKQKKHNTSDIIACCLLLWVILAELDMIPLSVIVYFHSSRLARCCYQCQTLYWMDQKRHLHCCLHSY